MAECAVCGRDDDFLFTCPNCTSRYCADHHRPAAHQCPSATQGEASTPNGESTNLLESGQGKTGVISASQNSSNATGIIESIGDQWLRFRNFGQRVLQDRSPSFQIALVVVTVVLVAFMAVTVGTGLPFRSNSNPTDAVAMGVNESSVEAEVISEINKHRRNNGIEPLTKNSTLAKAAQYHSDDMSAQNYTAHVSLSGSTVRDRFQRFNIECPVVGEVILLSHFDRPILVQNHTERYTSETELARGVVTRWMTSQPNRAVLLNTTWSQAGVGLNETRDHRVYVTLNFCGFQA